MPSRRPRPARRLLLLLLVVVASGASALFAALRTSTTFDEIVLVSAGARALETGSWSLVVDQPPLMPFLYGLPFRFVEVGYPSEVGRRLGYDDRWEYARDFFFRVGNDPERMALLARLVSVGTVLLLVLLSWAWGWWISGPKTALFAALLVAFLPDVVAHGAVAYNDVPLALGFLLAVWALDVAVRDPGVLRGAVAGAAVALAFGVKFSALALGPVAVALVVLEWFGGDGEERAHRGGWWSRLLLGSLAGVVAGYVVLVVLYRGDVLLLGLERGVRFTIEHATEGHAAPAWLLGETSPDGWWYYFPVAFLVKTPAALHLAIPVAAAGLLLGGRGARGGRLRAMARSRARGPAVGAAVFGVFLLASSLNIGFRYALPAVVPALVLASVGLGRIWSISGGRRRAALVLLALMYAGSTLTAAPWFISYRSEWFRLRPPGKEALLDSSFDWGQGLLGLREWMAAEGVEEVRLGYFGSALPAGYGIEVDMLPSFLPPPPEAPGTPPVEDRTAGGPEHVVVSATLLHGLYLPGDPYVRLREEEPVAVVGGSLYVYRIHSPDPSRTSSVPGRTVRSSPRHPRPAPDLARPAGIPGSHASRR